MIHLHNFNLMYQMALTLVGPASWQAAAIAASSNFVQVNFPAADEEEEHFQGEGQGG